MTVEEQDNIYKQFHALPNEADIYANLACHMVRQERAKYTALVSYLKQIEEIAKQVN